VVRANVSAKIIGASGCILIDPSPANGLPVGEIMGLHEIAPIRIYSPANGTSATVPERMSGS
jgi:hypothetical protein